MDSAEIVERGTILRATVGSTVHGLHHGGQDDRDEMAVFVEPPEYLLGLARARGIRGGMYGFEHFVARTQPEGVRSGPGDLDLVAYSLRKYVRLALKGHPTILLLLRSVRIRALRRANPARGCSFRAGRPRPRRLQPAQVRPSCAEGSPDDPAAPAIGTDSSTSSREPSPRVFVPGRATSTSSPTACASTSVLR